MKLSIQPKRTNIIRQFLNNLQVGIIHTNNSASILYEIFDKLIRPYVSLTIGKAVHGKLK